MLFRIRGAAESFGQDAFYAVRGFRKAWGATAMIVVTLALGIGANSAIFTVLSAVLLRPLPYRDANRLVVVWSQQARDRTAPAFFDSYRDFEIFRERSHSLEQVAAATWATGGKILSGAGAAREVLAIPVTLDFFRMLGIPAQLGRSFEQADLKGGCSVVLSNEFWASLAGSAGLGQAIRLGDESCTVLGVMPPGFAFYPEPTAMWSLITPLSPLARDPANSNVGVFARLRGGVSLAAAQAELTKIFREEHRGDALGRERVPGVFSLKEQFSYLTGPNLRLSLLVLFAGVSLVLLIACLNVANLLVGRLEYRQREMAIRKALGAGRGALVRQLLTESLLLAGGGAGLGVLLAAGAIAWFRKVAPVPLPPGNPVEMNVWVLLYTGALACGATLIAGLAPAWSASRTDVNEQLKAGVRTTSGGRSGWRMAGLLVLLEVAFAMVLLAGAALLIQSFERFSGQSLGFKPDGLFAVGLHLPEWRYGKSGERAKVYRSIEESVPEVAGIRQAALVDSLPLNGGRFAATALQVRGQARPTPAPREAAVIRVSDGYFGVMQLPLQRGRDFEARDNESGRQVAIVNEALVRRYFPKSDPLGQEIRLVPSNDAREAGAAPWWTIIGVVPDERESDFFQEMIWREIPYVFRPVAQDPPLAISVLGRTGRTESGAITRAIREIDPAIAVDEMEPMTRRMERVLAYPRFRAELLAAFAGLALVLATTGLYGVLAQSVRRRRREMGIRIALGAQRRHVIAMVLSQAMLAVGNGLALGVILTVLLTRGLRLLLFGVGSADPMTLGVLGIGTLLVGLLASYAPALRAASVDPAVTLRAE